MADTFRSTREVILRTEAWDQATAFYGSVLGLQVSYRSDHLVGFETGSFCLYVERGEAHGPVFELLVDDLIAAKARLVAERCTVQEEDPSVPRCYVRDPYGFVFNLRAR
ncbi:VOC family protein [Dyella humicola]|uniref:VOC family protein n=1 Tax=Dyella humicola TaxID=2992126 RepID=UPI002255D926|nr:VOC family protein [Dyella humicola]